MLRRRLTRHSDVDREGQSQERPSGNAVERCMTTRLVLTLVLGFVGCLGVETVAATPAAAMAACDVPLVEDPDLPTTADGEGEATADAWVAHVPPSPRRRMAAALPADPPESVTAFPTPPVRAPPRLRLRWESGR